MKQEFTKSFMRNNCGCYSHEKLHACSFMQTSCDNVTLLQILKSEIPLRDKFWFVTRKVARTDERKEIAIEVAEIVLPIYEKKYPTDDRVSKCIEATKKYMVGEISYDELMLKRRAAAAAADAYAAAYAAAAAAAAADAYAAAYAAAAAAAAADAAAYAAAYAAAAAAADAAADADAYAAAYAAAYQNKLLKALLKYCE